MFFLSFVGSLFFLIMILFKQKITEVLFVIKVPKKANFETDPTRARQGVLRTSYCEGRRRRRSCVGEG